MLWTAEIMSIFSIVTRHIPAEKQAPGGGLLVIENIAIVSILSYDADEFNGFCSGSGKGV
jgi:hypothetical protein